jgi:SAM-dependent methyltransferase
MKKPKIERGKGYSESEAFAYLAKVSNEKLLQKREIIKIIRKIKNRENYLDIGAGAGDISFDVAHKFKNSVFIEPGDKMFSLLKNKAKEHKTSRLRLIKSNWEEFYLKNKRNYQNKFDLITLVHVVYFLKPLDEKLKEILEFLSPRGKLVVICPTGKNERGGFYWIKQKLLKKPFESHPDFIEIPKMFPRKIKYEDIISGTKIRTIDSLEKSPLSKINQPTNFYLKFAIKKEFFELTKKDKALLRRCLKKHKKGDCYYVPGESRIYVIEK